MAKRRILIADDTQTIRVITRVLLMGWDIEFDDAIDGLEALKKAKETLPDLILSDVQMPGLDGFELCAAIRSDPALQNVPVILMTAQKDEASRMKGKIVGATDFLTKPVTADALRERVSNLLKLPLPSGGKK